MTILATPVRYISVLTKAEHYSPSYRKSDAAETERRKEEKMRRGGALANIYSVEREEAPAKFGEVSFFLAVGLCFGTPRLVKAGNSNTQESF